MRSPRSLALCFSALWLGAALCVSASLALADTVNLVPDDKASWSVGRMFAFLRPGHNFGDRNLYVETTPPGAELDLYYVRAGFQKRYEQADAPATVVLPRRVEASSRDSVTIRAFAEGYRAREVTVRVKSRQENILIELDPLPNTLRTLAHIYLGGRGSLMFWTDEAPEMRVQEADGYFSVAIHQTGQGTALKDSLEGVKSPLVEGLEAQQIGEDLLVRVALGKQGLKGLELRSRQGHDAVRDLYFYSIDMVPADGGAALVERARGALARIRSSDVRGCAEAFDSALRDAMEPAKLSRALTPRGDFTDPYLRAAMRRLGEVSLGGTIHMTDGTVYRPEQALELAAAMSQASQARGYLALLRRFLIHLEGSGNWRTGLHSLVGPELSARQFAERLDTAENAERRCAGR